MNIILYEKFLRYGEYMIYFDNAATGGKKPENVIAAVLSSVKLCANPGRSGHKLSLAHAEKIFRTRKALSEFFDGYGYERVAFTKNCTEALNLALLGLLSKGDHVVTTCMEHNSVLRPLEFLKKQGIVSYDVCPLENGNINPVTLAALVTEKTKAVVITTASNVTGAIPPIEKIRAVLPPEILLIADGAQGGGHIPVSMKKCGIDALALAGHKGLMGIQGSGALLFSDRVRPRPLLRGGTGSDSFSLEQPDFYPDALEAGTLSFPAAVSLFEGLKYLKVNGQADAQKLVDLTAYCIKKLNVVTNARVYSKPNPCGIVAFEIDGVSSETVAGDLSEKGFCVRGGFHCAPLMHEALNTSENGLIRASFSPFNSFAEIDLFISALSSD